MRLRPVLLFVLLAELALLLLVSPVATAVTMAVTVIALVTVRAAFCSFERLAAFAAQD